MLSISGCYESTCATCTGDPSYRCLSCIDGYVHNSTDYSCIGECTIWSIMMTKTNASVMDSCSPHSSLSFYVWYMCHVAKHCGLFILYRIFWLRQLWSMSMWVCSLEKNDENGRLFSWCFMPLVSQDIVSCPYHNEVHVSCSFTGYCRIYFPLENCSEHLAKKHQCSLVIVLPLHFLCLPLCWITLWLEFLLSVESPLANLLSE